MALLYPAGQQFGDSNMDPVGAGKLYVYDNGTTNAASTYSNPDLSTGALSSPIVLDSSGRLTTNVYVADGTSFTVKLDTSADAELWSRDDVWGVSSVDFNTDGDLTLSGNLLTIEPSADEDTGVKSVNAIGGVWLYVQNASGIAYIRQIAPAGTTEDVWISMTRNGAVGLRYDNTERIATTSTGAAVTGTTIALSSKPGTYTPTNVTPDRSFDADSTSTAELADVLGTLIADLQTIGLIG